jgi:DNA-directed RNA polymerase specialized sigma24 family protein
MVDHGNTARGAVFAVPDTATATATASGQTESVLTGRWRDWYQVAARYARKVPAEDRPDTTHDILLSLAEQERRDGAALPLARARKIASNTVADYYRARYAPRPTLMLESPINGSEDDSDTLAEFVPDDAPLDHDARLDAAAT